MEVTGKWLGGGEKDVYKGVWKRADMGWQPLLSECKMGGWWIGLRLEG